MIFIIGITLTFFLEFLLLSKKIKIKADYILAAWMFFIGMHLSLFYLWYAGLQASYPVLIGYALPLPLVHGPFLYLYVATLTNQLPRRKILQWIHFAPALMIYGYMIPFFMLTNEERIAVIDSGGKGYEAFNQILYVLILISGVVYVTASQLLLNRYRKIIREEFSNIEKINLNWLQYNIFGIGFIWVVIIAGSLLFGEYINSHGINLDIYIFSSVVLFVSFIGFFGLRQTNVFVANEALLARYQAKVPEEQGGDKGIEKYAKSGLKDAAAEQLHKQLIEYMNLKKPYLNSDLSLSKLGENLGVHPNYLSQVINERENKNFYDYVNGYRIEEFKNLVSDPKNKNFTILALAYESGFNSKSAFNICFKKATGQTPSEYMTLKN